MIKGANLQSLALLLKLNKGPPQLLITSAFTKVVALFNQFNETRR